MSKRILSAAFSAGLLGLALLFSSAASAQQSVNLSPVANIYGIGTLGVAVTVPNLDGSGSGAYATNLLGTSRSFGGASFNFLAPGAKSAVTKAVVPLPAGKFTALKFLGAGSGANQLNQPFIVTYTDGTTKTFTQNLSNYGGTPQNYPNETVVLTMPYKISTTGVQHNGSYHVLGYSFALDSTKTVKSFTLPNTSGVFAIAMNLTPAAASTTTKVSLSSVDNIYGIGTLGVPVTVPNLDGSGSGAYATNLLGTSLSFGGASFSFAAPGPKSAVTKAVVPLPAGKFTALKFLGAGSGANQLNQPFIVTYTDGTTKTFTQNLSNYGGTPQNYPNETVVLTMPCKISTTGVQHNGSYHVLGYTFALDGTKTVKSFTLPNTSAVFVIALDVIASGAPSAATPAFNPLPGTFTTGPTVNLSDTTPGASIFFTTNGTTPTTSSTKYTVPFKITATNGVETVEAMAVASGFSNSPVVIAAYTVNPSATPTATPTFSPTPGTFTFGPSVSLSDTTSGASIFFTTDGSTPTAASTKYASAFKLSKTSTVKAIAIASGHTISAVASATYTVTTPAPSALSYSVPPPLLIGKSVSLSPTVTGTVTAYSVSPGLPTGLALNTATGVISGKPTTVTAEASYTITASNGSGSTTFVLALKVDLGPTVHLTATATTSMGTAPTFTWKTTDGVLLNTNGAQTDWLLPPGFGLHFAYVMVADGRGGFREGRLVVNTDSFGAPPVIPVASLPRSVAASAYRPPAAAAAPNVAKHSVLLGADNGSVTPGVASTTLNVDGSVQLADHNLPGATDPFFGLNVAATVALTTPTCITNADCPSVESTRPFGEFAFSAADPGPVGTTVTVTAQSQNSNSASTAFTLTQTDLSLGLLLPPLLIPGSAAPTISAMSATFNSVSVGIFQLVWPTTAGQPSDGYPQQNWFLSFKGDDTRLSACQYYLAVGAVSTCDSSGKFTGGINFTDWRKQVQIDSFAPGGAVTTTATYVNVVDLNLTRSHHSIVYPGGQVGTYVCNSLGPVDSSGKPITVNLPASSMTAAQQTAVNAAVTNAINGKNLVACVAMDYISTPINGFAQFTRFLVFGPDGELLPSVNLDGRGEKFLPGACVACHGGDSYSGKFPENGTGAPDIGAHFLPYDTGNFAFSTQAGLTQAAQEAAIYQLNQNITGTNPTPNTSNLIAGWYQAGHVLDQNYVPTEWASYPDLYRTVVARSCRTCHAALPNFDWDASGPNGFQTTALQVCDGGGLDAVGLTGTQAMPNSKVTFDRLWDSAGTSEDQPAKLTAFYQSRGFMGSTSTCILRKALH